MLSILKNSIIWYIMVYCIKWFDNIYRNSILKQIVNKVSNTFENSYLGKISKGYSRQEPIYFNSKIYNYIEQIFELCRKVTAFFAKPIHFFRERTSGITKILVMVLTVLLVGLIGLINVKLAVVAVAVLVGVTYILSDYERATYILALYAILDTVFRRYIVSLASAWDELFLICLCMLWVFKWAMYKKEKALKTSPFDSCIIIFIAIMVFLMIVSPKTAIAVEGFRVIVQNMFWYFVVLQLLRSENGIKRISTLFVGLVGVLAIHGVYQYIIGVEMPSTWISSSEVGIRTRVYSIFTSPNIFGSLIVLAFPICIAMIFVSKQLKERFIYGLLLLFMAASLVFTYSRGAWIGVACAVGIYVLLKDRRLLVPAIIGGLLILVLVPSIGNRILYMLSPEYMASSMKGGRLIRWITGFQILQEHPWFGLGLGSFGGAVAANHGLSAIVRGKIVPTFYMDNYYMKIAAEAGIVGITAFLWLMWQVFSISLKTVTIVKDKTMKELGTGILAGMVGVMIHCFVENVFEVPMMAAMFWMFVAIMGQLWYSNYEKKEI